ncbi:IS630 family transposase [Desulfonema ishimotonii]|uniref:IS630 family transposase n=2 Tax=Desulfonema ishimotonii TaxID=45657 RepID=A0A401FTX8_9BACT|nr:IS630 family transposase [Desulfonema ishimotonii]
MLAATDSCIEQVSSVIGCCIRTITNWVGLYNTQGIESLNSFNYKSKKSYLTFNQINQVIIYVNFDFPENTKEIREYIKDMFNVTYSEEAVRQLLVRRGLRLLQPKTVPGSPPPISEQKQFVRQYHELRNETGTKILFGDAMHLHHQYLPNRCWGDPGCPPVFETNSGRKRLNILGAYDIENHSLIHLTGEENCNADRVIEFFEKISQCYREYSEIYITVDNARYFHARKVSEWLENNPKIRLWFLPAYAPNLNLIERFWRFAKKNLVRGKYYKEYKTFRAKVFQFLNNTTDHIDELKSLMVEKFEMIYA